MMTDMAMEHPGTRGGRWKSAVVGTGRRIRTTYRLGARAIVAAPLLVALAVLPELAQHVVEIKLGMFASRDAFRALANDPLRWAFGYAKVAGFTLAILGLARFWAVGSLARLVRPGWAMLGRVVLGLALGAAQSLAFRPLQGQGALADGVLTLLSVLIQAALFVYVVGALVGDRGATLRWSFTAGWPRAAFMTLLLVLTFAPCQLLHMANHRLALGAAAPVVWGAMLWDGLFVGLFAALVGAALFVGYRHGPDWRGWDRGEADAG